ncbi:MAG: DUF2029 domain-containing protein [Acidobacteriaceae bacterium]|nr:DUF2029 domain-containing protein [Acidobacteriaceae bacterium]
MGTPVTKEQRLQEIPQKDANQRPRILIYGSIAILAIASSLFLTKSVDLAVYWYAVNGFFSGTRPAYGPASGIGFPMEYRYPPVTYLLLFPLKYLSFRVAGFWWMLAAWINGTLAVTLAIRIRGLRFTSRSVAACCTFLLAYLVLAVRYGNVQPFVIAWIFLALVLSETQPLWSGILMALAVTFKIWPILFLPWLLRRTRIRAAVSFALGLALLWLAPVTAFGATGYWALLHQWYEAVGRVGTTYSEFYYFPGQSLRGLLLRYLTPIEPPLKRFPHINILSLSPHTAVIAWVIIALAVYIFFAVQVLRADERKLWAWDGLAFVLYSLLEPYAVKSGLISLAPAVLIASCLFTQGIDRGPWNSELAVSERQAIARANALFIAACSLSFAQAILQYKPWQQYLLSFGLDFWGEVLLLTAFCLWLRTRLPCAPRADVLIGDQARGV